MGGRDTQNGREGGVFTHDHVTPPVSGDLQERSCSSGLLTLTLFTASLQPPMWIPTIVFLFFYKLAGEKAQTRLR